MNILTLLDVIIDAAAADSATKSWSNINYGRDHSVYIGIDARNPPAETSYPLIHIFPVNKILGYELDQKDHAIGVNCGIYDADSKTHTHQNITELESVRNLESFRKLVETAVVSASYSPAIINRLSIDYETVEFFPYLIAMQEFKFTDDYYQGPEVFE